MSGRSISGNSAVTAVSNIASSTLGFIVGVIVARSLGPAGRGKFAFVTTMAAIVVMLAGQGVSAALTRAKAKHGRRIEELYAAAAIVAVLAGTVAGLTFGGVFLVLRRQVFDGITGGEVIWVMALASPLLLLTHWTVIAYLDDRIMEFGLAALLGSGLFALAVIVTAAIGAMSVPLVITLWASTSVVPAMVVIRGRRLRGIRHVWPTVVEIFRFGTVANIAAIALVLAWRLDVVLVKGYRNFHELGLYAVAVGLAEILLQVAVAVRVALTPRQGSADNREGLVELICDVNRVVMLGTATGAAGLAIGGSLFIRLVYGPAFGASAAAFEWLLPGIVLLSLQGPLIDYLLVEGEVAWVTLATLAALVTNVGLDVLLLRHHTFVAAAVASTAAYSVSFVGCLAIFSCRVSVPIRQLIVPRRRDLDAIRQVGSRVICRARGRSERMV